jgi:hypothetical protein
MSSNQLRAFRPGFPSALCAVAATAILWARPALAQPTATPGSPDAAATPAPATPPPIEAAVQPAPAPAPSQPPEALAVAPEPKEAKKDDKTALHASYDKGLLFTTEDGTFETRVALRTQFRVEVFRPLDGVDEFQSRFSINRARLQLEGHVHGKDNRYKLELGLGDAGSFSFVKDLYLERKVSSLWLRLGQWKRPYNRQEITSDFANEFAERAVTNEFAGGGRDIGFAVHNDYEKSKDGLEWVLGVFNGFSGGSDRPTQTTTTTCTSTATGAIDCRSATSRPSNLPTDFRPAIVTRVGWNFGKIKGYSEGDLEGGPLRFAVAASYKVDLANFTKGEQSSKVDNFSHAAEIDAIVNEGLDVTVGVFVQKLPGIDAEFGALLQGGMFLVPKQTQLAARFAIHQAPLDRNQLEGRFAVNYYLSGHSLKLASDFGFLQLTGENAAGVEDDPDLQARVTAQMTF